MHLDSIDTNSTSHSHGVGNFVVSCILLLSAFTFDVAQTMTVELLYVWLFRALSLISLALVVYINWNKAREIFKSRKNKIDSTDQKSK
jgi:hypothetical protein